MSIRGLEQTYAKAGSQRAVTKLRNPPRETMIHAALYDARPDVNSVVHTHQTLATAFSIAGTPILPIYNQAAVFAPETPIFPSPRLIYTVQDGKEVCETLGDRMAMLLKGHGVVMVGDVLELLPFTRFIWSARLTCSSSPLASVNRRLCRRRKLTT